MLRRLIQWNAARREWSREHKRTWAGAAEATESGLSPFQVMCESAVLSGLQNVGLAVIGRTVEGTRERYIKAQIAGTDWTLWIYRDGAEVSSKTSDLVRMEEWDAKTPEEFIATFVRRVLSGVRK